MPLTKKKPSFIQAVQNSLRKENEDVKEVEQEGSSEGYESIDGESSEEREAGKSSPVPSSPGRQEAVLTSKRRRRH